MANLLYPARSDRAWRGFVLQVRMRSVPMPTSAFRPASVRASRRTTSTTNRIGPSLTTLVLVGIADMIHHLFSVSTVHKRLWIKSNDEAFHRNVGSARCRQGNEAWACLKDRVLTSVWHDHLLRRQRPYVGWQKPRGIRRDQVFDPGASTGRSCRSHLKSSSGVARTVGESLGPSVRGPWKPDPGRELPAVDDSEL